LAFILAAGVVWYVTKPSDSPGGRGGRGAGGQPVTVGIATADKADIPIIIRALGTVTPLANVTVKTQITGQLVQVNFTEGEAVKKNDLLAVVDPRPYEVALQQAIGAQEKDEALLKNAQVDLARYKKLVAQDSLARQTLDTQDALVRQYEAALITDRAAVDSAKLNLVYTRIIAPTDGRVGLRLVDPGNYVTMGDATGICVLTLMQPMSVLFTIPEDSLPAVRKRLREGATLQVTALDRAQKVELGVGKVSTLDNQVDTTTGTVKLRAMFDNSDEALFPNQFVNIRLLVDTVKDAIAVPISAIQRGQPGTFVYRLKPDDTVEIRVIQTGATDGEKIAVVKGLEIGDKVVTDGTDRLREGSKVRLPNQAAPGQNGKAGAPVANAPSGADSSANQNGNGQNRRRGSGAGRSAQSNQ